MKITDNPFFTLGVSTRADRKQIAAAADAKAFEHDSEAVREARTALVIPGKRLCAEVRWFPAMGDERVREIAEFFRRISEGQPPGKINTSDFRGLILLNFAVNMFSYRKFRNTADMSKSILAMCKCFGTLHVKGICAVINLDRYVAGFPPVSEQELERELNDYRRDILKVIDGRMSTLSPQKYIELSADLANNYAKYGSLLLDDLLAVYELNIFPQLEEQKSMIDDSVSSIGENVSEKFFAELSGYLVKWRKLADPLLTAAKFTGMEDNNVHRQGREIFETVQKLGLTLNNEHGRTGDALRLILMMKEYIGPVSESLSERINRDVKELRKIKDNQDQAEREREAWEKSIYYETEFGPFSRDKLIISVEGISWRGVFVPVDEIYGMSWGGVNQYFNGVYMGTNYTINIQAHSMNIQLEPDEKKYNEITEHIWQAAASSITTRIFTQLQNGEMLSFGSIKLKDNGVYLKKSGDTKFFTWADRLRVYSENGYFVIVKGSCSAKASYIDDMNTHILESILRHFLSEPRNASSRLSSLME